MCLKDEKLVASNNAISMVEATEFAVNYVNRQGRLKSGGFKRAKETKVISTPFGNKKIFAVNIEDGGFVIMSDNILNYPVLGYSGKGIWTGKNLSDLPPVVEMYLLDLIQSNIAIENDTLLQKEHKTQHLWGKFNSTLKSAAIVDPDDCWEYFEGHVDETFLCNHWETEYAQGHPFNACRADCGGDPRLLGCGLVAIGTVIRVHEYPSNFISWSLLDDSYVWNSTYQCGSVISSYFNKIHDYADGPAMHINCQHLLTPNEMEDVLKDIGYPLVNNIEWDIDEMRRELTAGNPVILKGADNLFHQHYWTALGFQQSYDKYRVESSSSGGGVAITERWDNHVQEFFLDWGWRGNYNGWFLSIDVTRPGNGKHYIKNRRMIDGIKP